MAFNRELLKGSTGLLVLTVLARRQMYGYEIIKELEQRSNRAFALGEGTLYPLLHALEVDGSVESEWVEAEGQRRRRYYRLTRQGRAQLKARREEWEQFRAAVDRVVAGAGR